MKTWTGNSGLTAFIPAMLMAVAACTSGKMQGTEQVTVAQTKHGVIVVDTFTSDATVAAVNLKDRKVTLAFADGKKTTFKADSGMVNFGQLAVGDRVSATVTEQAAVSIYKTTRPPNAAAVGVAALAPAGAKPGGVLVATYEVTATVASVDAQHRKVTLQFVDGKPQTFKVSNDVNLANVTAGESVVAEVTEGVAISVVKP